MGLGERSVHGCCWRAVGQDYFLQGGNNFVGAPVPLMLPDGCGWLGTALGEAPAEAGRLGDMGRQKNAGVGKAVLGRKMESIRNGACRHFCAQSSYRSLSLWHMLYS